MQVKIQRDIEAALAEPDIRERYATFGYDVFPTTIHLAATEAVATSALSSPRLRRFSASRRNFVERLP